MPRRALLAVLIALAAAQAAAETVVATRTIRPQEVLSAEDIRLDAADVPGAHSDPAAVIGQEARVALYPGRAIMRGSLGEPALIERNTIVELVYSGGGLRIVTEGRALGRAGAGERVRVMNLSSRQTLFGTVLPDGSVSVSR